MNFLASLASPFLVFLKKLVRSVELRKYREALRRNPQDHYLRARYAKYCLNSYFQDNTSKIHVIEAVNQFESIEHSEVLDLEVFYLMGKFYQGKDNQKAIDIYMKGIQRYNDFVDKSIEFRHEHVETAFAIALNLLGLESNNADPELAKFFKNLRRTYLKNFLDHKMDFEPEILRKASGMHPTIN
jgi:mRNA-degrading endonuclease RelE of RelBE toxin-antitoxin system